MIRKCWKKYNFKKEVDYGVIAFFLSCILITLATIFTFVGCVKPKENKPRLECIEGHIYSILPDTRTELIEKDGCKSGMIEMEF